MSRLSPIRLHLFLQMHLPILHVDFSCTYEFTIDLITSRIEFRNDYLHGQEEKPPFPDWRFRAGSCSVQIVEISVADDEASVVGHVGEDDIGPGGEGW